MNEFGRQKVLIIDGEHRQSVLVQGYLEEAGYQVFETGEGQYAAAMLAKVMPQVVMLDWNLPDMSVLAVTRMIRADGRFTGLPIVLIGREIGSEDKILALEAGADLCLDGIIQPKELAARLRSLLRRVKS